MAREFVGSGHRCVNCQRERTLGDWTASKGGRCGACRRHWWLYRQEHPVPILPRGRTPKPPAPCVECGYVTPLHARGYCLACYSRQRRRKQQATS